MDSAISALSGRAHPDLSCQPATRRAGSVTSRRSGWADAGRMDFAASSSHARSLTAPPSSRSASTTSSCSCVGRRDLRGDHHYLSCPMVVLPLEMVLLTMPPSRPPDRAQVRPARALGRGKGPCLSRGPRRILVLGPVRAESGTRPTLPRCTLDARRRMPSSLRGGLDDGEPAPQGHPVRHSCARREHPSGTGPPYRPAD